MTSDARQKRILIVDDDDDLREQLKEQLALHDEFELTTASTAGKGLEQMIEALPAIVARTHDEPRASTQRVRFAFAAERVDGHAGHPHGVEMRA